MLVAHVVARHWQVFAGCAFGNQKLHNVNVAGFKRGRACLQIQIPHAREPLTHHVLNVGPVRVEVHVPDFQGTLIVTPQHFDISNLQVVFNDMANHFLQSRDPPGKMYLLIQPL